MPAAFDVRSVTHAIIETLVNSVIRIQTTVNNIDLFEPYEQPQAETPLGQVSLCSWATSPIPLIPCPDECARSLRRLHGAGATSHVRSGDLRTYVFLIYQHFDPAMIRWADPAAFKIALAKHQLALEMVHFTNMSVSFGLEVAQWVFPSAPPLCNSVEASFRQKLLKQKISQLF